MARHREFDPRQALHRAMLVFWEKGYEASSLRDLTEHMEISRQSLYDTFGDKHQLFLAALDHYEQTVLEPAIQKLSQPDSGLNTITEVFTEIRSGILEKGPGACFVAVSAVDLGHLDGTVRAKVQAYIHRLHHAFTVAMQNALDRDEMIRQDRNPRTLAAYLISSLLGLGILSRSGIAAEDLHGIIDTILSTLTAG